MSTNSAGVKLIEACRRAGLRVYAHDPLYTKDELEAATGAEYLDPLAAEFHIDCVITTVKHDAYSDGSYLAAVLNSGKPARVIDCIDFPNLPDHVDSEIDLLTLGTKSW